MNYEISFVGGLFRVYENNCEVTASSSYSEAREYVRVKQDEEPAYEGQETDEALDLWQESC